MFPGPQTFLAQHGPLQSYFAELAFPVVEDVPTVGIVQDSYFEVDEMQLLEKLSIMQSLHGIDHPDSFGTWSELGNIFLHQGRWKAAEELFQKLAGASQRENGVHHNTTLAAFSDFGRALMAQGLLPKGKTLLRKTYDNLSLMVDPVTLLSQLHRTQERCSLVEELILQEAERRINTFGMHHPNTQQGLQNLAGSYLWTAQLEALRHEKEGLGKETVLSHDIQEVQPEMTYNMADLCVPM
jgi:tetratricopeptide (TPR) repeat protein